jgi:hypothetical protein
MRRSHIFSTIAGEVSVAEIIDKDEEHIGLLSSRSSVNNGHS